LTPRDGGSFATAHPVGGTARSAGGPGPRETTMLRRSLRRSSLATGVLFALALPAQAQERTFDLPAGMAHHSLPEFARQASVQIVAPGERLADQRTPSLHGTYDSRAALSRLLAGTGLRVAHDDGRTITLSAAADASGAADAPAGPQQSRPEDPAAPPQQQPDDPPPEPGAPAARSGEEVSELDSIVVTGTYLRRTDAETALPVTTLTRTDIELSGVNTAAELLAQLPQSAEFDNSETATGPNDARGDAASVNLRGLGSGNTLVLLNGRRIAPHPISAGAVPRLSSNINQIPLGAVQSIEVLRDGASALYGSDAVAGVVNTRLRRDYQGLETSLRYG